MARASDDDVRALVDDDASISMNIFIETAAELTDYVESCDTGSTLPSRRLRLIETYLAAHFYLHRDQDLESEGAGKSQGRYRGKADLGFDGSKHGQTAMRMDTTGCLAKLNKQAKEGTRKIQMSWLGKAPSEQTDYVDRD
jgi:hypothetical protein